RDLTVTGVQTCALPISVTVRHGEEVAPLAVTAESAVEGHAVVAVAVRVAGHDLADEGRRHGDVDELLHLGGRHQLAGGRRLDEKIGRASCRERGESERV